MVVRHYHIAIALCVLLFFGCNPYRFRVETQHPVSCRIFSDHNDVESHLYGFTMHPNAVVQATSPSWTQFELAAYLTLSGGDGFQIMLRPVVEESVVDSGLVLTVSDQYGLRFDSAGQTLDEHSSYRFPKDSQTYITIYNEESYLRVTFGCDTVVNRYTKRRSSDDIVFRTLKGSELNVLDPEWRRIKFIQSNGDEVVHQVK